VVISADGKKVIYTIAPLSLSEALILTGQGELQELTETFLDEKFQGMWDDLKTIFLSQHAAEGSHVPTEPPPYPIEFFSSSSNIVVSMMSQVLGKKLYAMLGEVLLDFLASICPLTEGPFIKFNYAQFIFDAMH